MIPNFGKAVWYLHYGKYETPSLPRPSQSRVIWSTTRNLLSDDPWESVFLMDAIATQNRRVKEPGYHVGASLHPDESLGVEAWEMVAQAMLEKLGLEDHQAIIAVHEDRGHQHMHLIVNRVHIDGHAWKPSFDVIKLREVMRTMERRLGLRRVAEPRRPEPEETDTESVPEEWDERQAAARIREALLDALKQAPSWQDLDRVLADSGLRLAPARNGGGVVVTEGTDDDRRLSLSRVDPSLSGPRLAKRFGETIRAWLAQDPERAAVRVGTDEIELVAARHEANRIVETLGASQATWTERDVQIAAAHRPDVETVVALVGHHPGVQRIAIDSNGDVRFTTRQYLEREVLLFETAKRLAARRHSAIEPLDVHAHLDRHPGLSSEQRRAVLDATVLGDLALITGNPGAGKTTVAGVIAQAHRAQGHDVIGMAPSAFRAERLEEAGGIHSRSLEAWRHAWRSERAALRPGTVVIVDDAAEIETDRLASLFGRVERAGGRAVLIGNPEGLQPVGPGSAFRGLTETYQASSLGASFRTRERRDNSRAEGTENQQRESGEPSRKTVAPQVDWHDTPELAAKAVAEEIVRSWDERPNEPTLAITATRADAAQVNAAVQSIYEARGEREQAVRHRSLDLAVGDRVVFNRGDRSGAMVDAIDEPPGAIIRGDLGTVREIEVESAVLVVERDDGSHVRVDPTRYDHLTPAFALNVHQAAGREVDHTVVLASRHHGPAPRENRAVAASQRDPHRGRSRDRADACGPSAPARPNARQRHGVGLRRDRARRHASPSKRHGCRPSARSTTRPPGQARDFRPGCWQRQASSLRCCWPIKKSEAMSSRGNSSGRRGATSARSWIIVHRRRMRLPALSSHDEVSADETFSQLVASRTAFPAEQQHSPRTRCRRIATGSDRRSRRLGQDAHDPCPG